MPAFARATAVVVAVCCLTLGASPAVAANQGVRAKALHQTSVYEGYYTNVHFEYQCPIGSTASVFASISQPGTGAYYDSTAPFEPKPTLICDGKKHSESIGLISLGYTEENAAEYFAPDLEDTALGYGRGLVTVKITSGTKTATDSTRVAIQNRDV